MSGQKKLYVGGRLSEGLKISHVLEKSMLHYGVGEKTTYNCTLGHATTCHLFLSVSQIMVEGFLLEMTTTISATKKKNQNQIV